MTALEYGHTYCYDCIEARVEIGGNHNVCPVPGCGAVLGPSPFDHHRLVYDSLLDGLVAKIFPRPALDAALSKRRMEREAAVREARAAVNGRGGLGCLKSPAGGGGRSVLRQQADAISRTGGTLNLRAGAISWGGGGGRAASNG
ncbi:hypothetical protein CHLRE_12g545700v5 [Chlamydomonas reinhardtii]|uniref:Uncharacterized protein n=1 Tax=Chlamydomonas reinhardtii TaxID=3055 RepID=A0A2K3D6J0_CHLRE|nr:uncharacterized protein CHLRE_12g545700v5 [Chlamydomonas reinhardtii]PNW76152.1 hypothetical protein CHLRE_12g545700v5 [Chlamydomonas reinhardtii]